MGYEVQGLNTSATYCKKSAKTNRITYKVNNFTDSKYVSYFSPETGTHYTSTINKFKKEMRRID